MRKGGGPEVPSAKRERRARQLRLVLQCAGPGSVTGSRTSQCRREGRPHGGYKGLSSKYPLSRPGFDNQEFMEEVTNGVNAQYQEEQKCRTNSPQWLPAANKEKNHTGEQPLILQSFLAANKQEQVDGVLPAPKSIGKRQSKSADMYHDNPDYFCRGNSMHQYLTATEMPGQSERLVDLALGRPTRTSLLRVRQRTKSAPGVRAVVEIKTHLHKQQQLVAKTEDRYKSVDFPQDLLPVTEDDETVHQFLIGARYNRQDPLHCFKMNVPAKEGQMNAQLKGSVSSLNLTQSCESFGSDSNVSELAILNHDSPCPKSAWSASGQEDRPTASKGTLQRTTPAPSPSPANRSQETFSSRRSPGWRKRPKLKIIDGTSLQNSHATQDGGQECCIICRSEEPPRHYQRFAPGSHFIRVKEAGREDEDGDWHHDKDHMLVQQYHLRIMGIKYGMKSGPHAPPRSNLLYTSKKIANMTELPFIRQSKNLRDTNGNDSRYDTKTAPGAEASYARPERPSSNSSKIAVRVSSHNEAAEKEVKAAPPEDTVKTSVIADRECTKDGSDNPCGNVTASGQTQQTESYKEAVGRLRLHDAPSGDIYTSAGRDTNVDSPSEAVTASGIEQQKDGSAVVKNAETTADSGSGISQDVPVEGSGDADQDNAGDDEPKDNSNLGNGVREEPTDAQPGENQDSPGASHDIAGEDIHNDPLTDESGKELPESTESQSLTDIAIKDPSEAATGNHGDQ
ncbi:uncharacterized protein LOC110986002 isoform X2 [Acanthaster planci]|uniref:Uncharacterized protein LOC110986002 isoform X2 n=1 Tax=Acanthaster planci TaxID=133434 RepID=A0A8B7ZC52_ACAPL|nr:uncharacterized protein LOC110986002 isoform X2 [Acanthaster planci]